MKNIKQVFNEEDVTGLKAGDYVIIKGKPAMCKNDRGDGMDYLISGNQTVTIINLRAYNLSNGGIIPINYSERIIHLNKNVGTIK